MMDAGLIEYVSIFTPIKVSRMIWLMTDTALHIGKHLFVCLLGSFSSTILNPCQKFVFVEIEFFAFFIGRKQPFAYQCINGRLGFSDNTASILNFNQHMFVRWLWLEFRYHLFQLDNLFAIVQRIL